MTPEETAVAAVKTAEDQIKDAEAEVKISSALRNSFSVTSTLTIAWKRI